MLHRIMIAIASSVALLGVQATAPATASPAPTFHTAVAFHGQASALQIGSAYTPDQIAAAYDFSSLYDQNVDGAGQTIALIEIDRYSAADVAQFDQTYSLADPTISETYIGGRTFSLPIQGEADMDVEWAHALAPGAAIHIYYINPKLSDKAGWKAMATGVTQAVSNGAGIISISMGACGTSSGASSVKSAMKAVSNKGVSVFVSSGDTGDHPGPVKDCGNIVSVAYPASDRNVVAVGGTSLQLNEDDTIASETAWKLSGGGRVLNIPRPVWQTAASLPKDAYRWDPDVAFVGDPRTGVSIVYKGRFRQVGGTSLGAPAWAAAWALIRQNAQQSGLSLKTAAPLIYRVGNSTQYAATFHDVTVGSNGHYSAHAGWDPVTGWGTPDVGALSQAVDAIS